MIDVENIGRVRLLRLNRPEAKNAFNEAQYDSLTELLLEAEGDSTVAVVVITGQGDSFSYWNLVLNFTYGAPFAKRTQ